RWRIQRVSQQVIVKEILVPPEEEAEVVPFVLRQAHASDVFRITAPTEAAHVEIVEQYSRIVERMGGERLIKKARAGMLIDKGVIHCPAAVDVAEAIAELNALLHVVIADVLALGCGSRASRLCSPGTGLCQRQGRRHQDD